MQEPSSRRLCNNCDWICSREDVLTEPSDQRRSPGNLICMLWPTCGLIVSFFVARILRFVLASFCKSISLAYLVAIAGRMVPAHIPTSRCTRPRPSLLFKLSSACSGYFRSSRAFLKSDLHVFTASLKKSGARWLGGLERMSRGPGLESWTSSFTPHCLRLSPRQVQNWLRRSGWLQWRNLPLPRSGCSSWKCRQFSLCSSARCEIASSRSV